MARVDRRMSNKTWERIEDLIVKIRQESVRVKNNDIYRMADMAHALLQNLSGEIKMEDEKADRT